MRFRHLLLLMILPAAICCTQDIQVETPVQILPPEDFRLSDVGDTYLTYSWSAVEGAQSYMVRLEYADGSYTGGSVFGSVTVSTILSYVGTSGGMNGPGGMGGRPGRR